MFLRFDKTIENTNEAGENEESAPIEDPIVSGLKALIGASFIATSSRITSSTMASYLTRNHSRFQFSHNFGNLPLFEFCNNETGNECVLDSTEDGLPFFKSNMLNYICRPIKMENV